MNSMILHELFFDGLGDQNQPGVALRDALARDFGSFERWRSELVAMGKALGGGSGWVLLMWSPRDRRLVNQWASDHCHTLAGATPILALDMYEHSYHMDFGAKAATYVDTFMQVIRWGNADRLFDQVSKLRGRESENGPSALETGGYHACDRSAVVRRRGRDMGGGGECPANRLAEGR